MLIIRRNPQWPHSKDEIKKKKDAQQRVPPRAGTPVSPSGKQKGRLGAMAIRPVRASHNSNRMRMRMRIKKRSPENNHGNLGCQHSKAPLPSRSPHYKEQDFLPSPTIPAMQKGPPPNRLPPTQKHLDGESGNSPAWPLKNPHLWLQRLHSPDTGPYCRVPWTAPGFRLTTFWPRHHKCEAERCGLALFCVCRCVCVCVWPITNVCRRSHVMPVATKREQGHWLIRG
ncbi:hypothetical protein V8C42DRAFT_31395 [Trichoderma barbatum]